MQAGVLMQIGSYQFSTSTAAYDQLRRMTEYRWRSNVRMGKAPAKQYLGPGEDTIEISGSIYPHWQSGLYQVDDMRALAAKGKPQRIVAMPSIGKGYDMGLWVIESVSEEQSHIRPGGVPGRQRFILKISAYGE